MILSRIGNKKSLAEKIYVYFTDHDIYFEPFFGAGGMFFNKPKKRHNILNDFDDDVFNLFMVLTHNKEELLESFIKLPLSESLFKFWSDGNKENDKILKAVRFLFLSNFGFMGKLSTYRFGSFEFKNILLSRIEDTYKMIIDGCEFSCQDFRNAFKKIGKDYNCLIYCDPPYLETVNNYNTPVFTEQDSMDLFDLLEGCEKKWFMSEYGHPFILDQVEKRKLNCIDIVNKKAISGRATEILITNQNLNIINYEGLF